MSKFLILLCFLFCLFSPIFAQKSYKNLVFEGGGVRGIAYIGALEVLEEKNILSNVERVGGTSAGAITSLLLAVGYSVKEMQQILWDLKVQSFNDGFSLLKFNRNLGIYRGDKFENWLRTLIKVKTGKEDLTFEDLHRLAQKKEGKDLFVVGTNLSKQREEIFSYLSSPKMEIALAVRISMSIPFYYQAVALDENGQRIKKRNKQANPNYSLYIDGGVRQNYPIDLFDKTVFLSASGNEKDTTYNAETLGLKLERPEQIPYFQTDDGIAPYSIKNIKDYSSAFYNLLIESANRHYPIAYEKNRSIYISTVGISPKVKKMSNNDKMKLVQSGKEAATDFFAKRYQNTK